MPRPFIRVLDVSGLSKHGKRDDHDDHGGPALGVRRRGRPGSIARPKHGRPRDRAAVPSAGVSAHAGCDPSRKSRCALRAPRRPNLRRSPTLRSDNRQTIRMRSDAAVCLTSRVAVGCALFDALASSDLPGRIVAAARLHPTPCGLAGTSRSACGRGTQTVSELFSSVSARGPTRHRHRSCPATRQDHVPPIDTRRCGRRRL